MADNFESHFNWNLDSDVARIDRTQIQEKLLARIESDVTLKGKTHLLLSYMFAKNDVTGTVDFNKALVYTDGAMTSPDFSAGEKWLAKVNKSFILRELMQDEESLRLRSEAKTEFTSMADAEKATLILCKVFAISTLKTRAHDDVIACCDEVLRYNDECGEALLFKARGLTMRNKRRMMNDEEEHCYDLAARFWPDSPLPLVYKAHAFLYNIHFQNVATKVRQQIFQKADDLVDVGKSMAVEKRHSHALKECAAIDRLKISVLFAVDKRKAIKNIDRLTARQKDSIERAKEMDPRNSQILREYARFYAYNSIYKDASIASKGFKEAVEYATNDTEKLAAKVDLICHTTAQSEDYDSKLQQLQDMIPDFDNEELKIEIRNKMAFCYMDELKDFHRAYDVISTTLEQFKIMLPSSSKMVLSLFIKNLQKADRAGNHQQLLLQAKQLMAAYFPEENQ